MCYMLSKQGYLSEQRRALASAPDVLLLTEGEGLGRGHAGFAVDRGERPGEPVNCVYRAGGQVVGRYGGDGDGMK